MDDSTPRRRRGAQPGNTNAYRHGFYSHNPRLALLPPPDSSSLLDNEIESLRQMMDRVIEFSRSSASPNLLTVLHSLTLTAICINRLVRTQHILASRPKSDQEILQAVTTVLAELNKPRPDPPPSSNS